MIINPSPRILIIAVLLIMTIDPAMSQSEGIVKKSGFATRLIEAPKIDGRLDEKSWDKSIIFTGFRQYEPFSGNPATFKTFVRLLYDDDALYVGAFMEDPSPDSIMTQIGKRDGDRGIIADCFTVDLGPYNDGINGYTFKVTVSGVQTDIRRSAGEGGRDLNWDAVWFSSASICDSGWVAEIKIPWSAIRFPEGDDQVWGLNFWRNTQRRREWASWNWADKSHGTSIDYQGNVTGIEGISPRPRISLTPYGSAYLVKEPGEGGVQHILNAGADLKIGLNEAFTLDATLIPDFKQVQSDDQVLNLTPYEIKYNEKRQFFTEGTDVFNKGGIFYTRRVGMRPSGYYDVYRQADSSEIISVNPNETRLLNAMKISGRTRGGLGIGFFNAITGKSVAEISDTSSGSTRQFVTQPLSNYNMLVLDQNLGNGSFIALANTNVLRSGPSNGANYTANVTALDGRVYEKTRTWSITGRAVLSQKYYSDQDNIFGTRFDLSGGKTGGDFRLFYRLLSLSPQYDPNDMGYLRRNNEFNNYITTGFNIFEPRGIILTSRNSLTFSYEMLHTPRRFSEFAMDFSSITSFVNFWNAKAGIKIRPLSPHDYYEPRKEGMFYKKPPSVNMYLSVTTDPRKAISLTMMAGTEKFFSENEMVSLFMRFSPEFKLNDRIVLTYVLSPGNFRNDLGFAGFSGDDVLFGSRNVRSVENIGSVSIRQSADMLFELRARHYWSEADYTEYFVLNKDGTLTHENQDQGRDISTSWFNIDCSWNWRFAPGSEVSVVWKNQVYSSTTDTGMTWFETLSALSGTTASNSISLKILYYIDYNSLRPVSRN